jgi:hypothetical protein
VYGENGAGKSSLFHALQDFFSLQPSRKLAAHQNVFSGQPAEHCKVSVEFVGQDTKAAEWTSQQHPCHRNLKQTSKGWSDYFFRGADSRVLDAARRSACLDYRSLLDTNYKHGSGAVNLFELAVTKLLRDHPVTVGGGTEVTLGALWQSVLQAERSTKVPKPAAQALVTVNQSCIEFNTAFRQTLDRLLPEVNRILGALGWHNLVLVSLHTPGISYTNARLKRDRVVAGQSLTPELTYRGHALDKPQVFLNEARLSGLALALYLGGRLASIPAGETQSLKLMVLDDVLVGLDHSNRLPVLDVLATFFLDWQIVLLTHDRTWFDLARHRLPNENWMNYEIYEGDVAADAPMPIVRQTENRPARALLANGRRLLELGYVEAAANYTRQAFELGLRKGCEIQKIPMSYTVDPAAHRVQNFLDALKKAPKPAPVSQADWTDCLQRIEMFKNVVMNPYSHPSAPNIPRQEVIDAANAVEKFLELTGKK